MPEVEYAQESVQEWQLAPQFGSLPNGINFTIRRAKVSDAQPIKEMHQRLSKETIFSRYLHPYMPTLEDLQDLCSLDEKEGFAVVAAIEEPEEKVIGITCFYVGQQNPASAEPAIVVEDDYQGHGLGRQLIQNLGQYASMMGVSEFICYTHPNNDRVLGMAKGSGLDFESKYEQGMRVFRIRLNSNSQ